MTIEHEAEDGGRRGSHIVIFGANGGIGGALIDQYRTRDDVAVVHAVSRSDNPISDAIVQHQADITSERDLAQLATAINAYGQPDLIIVATGLLSDAPGLSPEKSYRQQSLGSFERVFRVNTFGPALVAKHMLPIMPRKRRAVFAALSARVGSISDNHLGGWHAYRASKAALNMLIRNYAIEQARVNDQFIAIGLHPGTVDTDLSAPFQITVPAERLFSPAQSARHLMHVLDNLRPEDSGTVVDWRGNEVSA